MLYKIIKFCLVGHTFLVVFNKLDIKNKAKKKGNKNDQIELIYYQKISFAK